MRQIPWQTMKKYLEQKTAQTLGVVDGAGKVTVMITLKSTGQKVVEKRSESTHQTTKEADSRERQEKVKRNLWIKRPCTVRGQTERRSHM